MGQNDIFLSTLGIDKLLRAKEMLSHLRARAHTIKEK